MHEEERDRFTKVQCEAVLGLLRVRVMARVRFRVRAVVKLAEGGPQARLWCEVRVMGILANAGEGRTALCYTCSKPQAQAQAQGLHRLSFLA